MRMKCPVCGSIMEEKIPFSGDLLQKYSGQYACTKCGYGSASDADILEETARRLQQEMEELPNVGK